MVAALEWGQKGHKHKTEEWGMTGDEGQAHRERTGERDEEPGAVASVAQKEVSGAI